MEEKIILPQNTRLMGALLGFIGGSLDVFCHMHYRSLVATQTGNLLLLIADWHDPRVENTVMRFSSIIFFSIGFLVALHIKEYRKTAFWRTKMLLPLFVVTLLIPLVSVIPPVEVPFIAFGTGMMMLTFTGSLIENHPYVIFMTSGNYRKMLIPLFVVTLLIPLVSVIPPVEVPFIAFGTGMMMLTFTGSLIETHPYVIFMTSGNYRKMLTALYRITRGKGDLDEYRRQAMNYGIVVGSFVAGAISVAILMHFIHQWAIWLITVNLFLIMTYYTARVKQLGLQTDNL